MTDDPAFDDKMRTSLPASADAIIFPMLVLLAVLFLTSMGQVSTPLRWRKNQRKLLTASAFRAKRFKNQTLSQTVAANTTEVTSI